MTDNRHVSADTSASTNATNGSGNLVCLHIVAGQNQRHYMNNQFLKNSV